MPSKKRTTYNSTQNSSKKSKPLIFNTSLSDMDGAAAASSSSGSVVEGGMVGNATTVLLNIIDQIQQLNIENNEIKSRCNDFHDKYHKLNYNAICGISLQQQDIYKTQNKIPKYEITNPYVVSTSYNRPFNLKQQLTLVFAENMALRRHCNELFAIYECQRIRLWNLFTALQDEIFYHQPDPNELLPEISGGAYPYPNNVPISFARNTSKLKFGIAYKLNYSSSTLETIAKSAPKGANLRNVMKAPASKPA